MTALSKDRKTDKLGPDDGVDPGLLSFPVAASTSIYGGALVALDASGNAVNVTASGALKVVGRAERQVLNLSTGGTISPDGIADGSAASIRVPVRQGVFYLNIHTDSTITKANFGANVFAVDDNTVSLTDAGGTRPYAGWILDPAGDMAPSPLSSQVGVFVGRTNPYAMNPELAISTGQYKARAVVTSLAAYAGTGTATLTASANGAWAAQDGITNALNDIVFIQGGTTNLTGALDSGPWQITSLGGAGKWTLTRPDWWAHGATMPVGSVIEIGGEGTLWAGSSWKSFAAVGSAVIGTNDPTFYVGRVTQQLTLTSSTVTLNNVGLRSASKSNIVCTFQAAGGTVTSTVGYGVITAPTAGYIGTATAVIDALASGMGKNGSSDASTIEVTVINW